FLFIFIMYLALFSKNTSLSITPLIGKKAPSFSLKTFDNKELSSVTLNDKGLVLNFWASWCVPCVEEVDVLDRANIKYQNDDIIFIGINIWDDNENAVNFINRYNANYLNGFDPKNEIQVNYGIQGVPETYFINKDGKIINRFQGQLTDNIIDYFCSEILKDKS
ncbi:MAG: TlpA family protein disulfide reductase, partial [Thermodesulfobacteriota bacterium]